MWIFDGLAAIFKMLGVIKKELGVLLLLLTLCSAEILTLDKIVLSQIYQESTNYPIQTKSSSSTSMAAPIISKSRLSSTPTASVKSPAPSSRYLFF